MEYPPAGAAHVATASWVEEVLKTTLFLVSAGFVLMALEALYFAL